MIFYDADSDSWYNLRVCTSASLTDNVQFNPHTFDDALGTIEESDVGEGNALAAFAGEFQDEGRAPYFITAAWIICGCQRTLFTACHQNREETKWAMDLFHKIRAGDNKNN